MKSILIRKYILLFLVLCSTSVFAQKMAIKNNLLYDAIKTPNLSFEFALNKKWTIDTQVGANFFFYKTDPTSSDYKTKKWSHWLVQPEARYWTCDVFNGWFFGLHAHVGQLNIGEIDIPFILNKGGVEMKDFRYESYFYGAGVSVGYQWVVSNHFNIEASLGVGYARVDYDKFKCASCGEKVDEGNADYLGPTKATLSLIYVIK